MRLHTAKGRAVRSLLARRGQILVNLDRQGCRDLELIRETRRVTHLLMSDAPALTILAWARSAVRLGGAFAEAGVFMGGSARLICETKGLAPLHLFDAFDTLQRDSNPRTDAAARAVSEHFGTVHSALAQVRELLSPYRHVHFHPGLFPGTAAAVEDRRFCFVHLDLDLGQGTADALEFFYPRLLPGGVLIGDDYNLAPVRDGFAAFFADRGATVAVLPWGQAVVVKG